MQIKHGSPTLSISNIIYIYAEKIAQLNFQTRTEIYKYGEQSPNAYFLSFKFCFFL